jgi:Uma2 family endonuclease
MNVIATLEHASARPGSIYDESLYEIVDGQRVELSPMGVYSGWISGVLFLQMQMHAAGHGLGRAVHEILFILDSVKDRRRRPDVAFVSAAKWPPDRLFPEAGDWEVVPDFAVEVVSPNDLFEELLAKMREYFRYGVSQVWIVLPSVQEIHVYDSPAKLRVYTADEVLDASPLLPGWRLAVGSLFQPLVQTPPADQSAKT